MTEKIKDMVKSGACAYFLLSDSLIGCGAKFRLPESAKTAIVMLFPDNTNFPFRNISRYAAVKDYHLVVMDILKNIAEGLKK